MIAKLHAILRPFLLRRMKTDVEQMLPRKKEIILYATMTDHQKNFQDHLVNKTLEDYLIENASAGTRSILLVKSSNEFTLRKERNGTHALCIYFLDLLLFSILMSVLREFFVCF